MKPRINWIVVVPPCQAAGMWQNLDLWSRLEGSRLCLAPEKELFEEFWGLIKKKFLPEFTCLVRDKQVKWKVFLGTIVIQYSLAAEVFEAQDDLQGRTEAFDEEDSRVNVKGICLNWTNTWLKLPMVWGLCSTPWTATSAWHLKFKQCETLLAVMIQAVAADSQNLKLHIFQSSMLQTLRSELPLFPFWRCGGE